MKWDAAPQVSVPGVWAFSRSAKKALAKEGTLAVSIEGWVSLDDTAHVYLVRVGPTGHYSILGVARF